eukprot:939692-Rhodomonas_salina.5
MLERMWDARGKRTRSCIAVMLEYVPRAFLGPKLLPARAAEAHCILHCPRPSGCLGRDRWHLVVHLVLSVLDSALLCRLAAPGTMQRAASE